MFLSFKQFLLLLIGFLVFLFFSKSHRKIVISFIKKSFVHFSKKK